MTNIQHSSRTPEHYTPLAYVEAARETMGGIDLDPATTKIVNDTRIKAASYYTKDDDGLTKSWAGRVWLNPPGGRLKGRTGSSAAIWWEKLVDEYTLGHVEQAVFLGFSIEILATSQDAQKWAGDFPICVPRKRIEFLTLGVADELEEGESPTHSNVIVYLPPWDRRERWSDWTNSEVNFIWMEPGGDKRCDPCVRAKAPINPALRGKLSEMDKLGMAKPIGIESGAALILSGPGNENDKAKALHAHLAKVYGLDPCQCAVCK